MLAVPSLSVDQSDLVGVGRISGLFGVRGWVRIYSYTEPRENILTFRPWFIGGKDNWKPMVPLEGKRHGKGIVARLETVEDREQAAKLLGQEIAVRREQLPEIGAGEYYWTDLEGLQVVTPAGETLGVVDHLMETGANDVLVVKGRRELLIPYVPGDVVLEVDLEGGRIRVSWDPDF